MEIDIDKLDKVPFQTQIIYTSPRGGKFLRVISSESKTTFEKKELTMKANLPVVHQRVTSMTANLYKQGDFKGSQQRNELWSNYLEDNFQEEKYEKHQVAFESKNRRLNKAINNKEVKPKKRKSKPLKRRQKRP